MQKILLANFSFVIASMVVMAGFITATTYIQLAVATLLFPLLVYFGFKAFPRKSFKSPTKEPVTEVQSTVKSEESEAIKKDGFGISDIDKRMFLKLIGGAGLTFLLFSIFNKKTEGLFSKAVPGSGSVSIQDANSKKIDPAQNQPMDGYRISEIEDKEISFYGYTNKEGAWFLMRVDAETGAVRYSRGDSNFPSNWGNRENLKYDYFNNVF